MTVYVDYIKAKSLVSHVQGLKDAGRKILDITGAKFKITGGKKDILTVTEYVVVSQ